MTSPLDGSNLFSPSNTRQPDSKMLLSITCKSDDQVQSFLGRENIVDSLFDKIIGIKNVIMSKELNSAITNNNYIIR